METAEAHARSLEAIAARLIATRGALGINQRQLCQRAGIEPPTYNNWEKARGRPDIDGAIQLCDAFRLTLDWIYLGDASGLPHDLALKLRAPAVEAARPAKGGRG